MVMAISGMIWSIWPHSPVHDVPFWVWLAGLLVPVPLIIRSYINWWEFFYETTDKNVALFNIPPLWLWWRKARNPRLQITKIQFAESEDQSWLGNWLGYGIVVVDGLSRLDVELNRLRFMPHHKEVADVVELLMN